jgi:hypothetical protein
MTNRSPNRLTCLCFDSGKQVISTLDVVWTTRSGGLGRTERSYLDFVVDGVPLSSRFDVDLISPFGWLDVEEQEASIARLLTDRPPDLPNGRSALYVCPECGDLGCGAVTLSVERGPGVFIWKNFGFENNYEDVVHTRGYEDIGPFTFDDAQYRQVFERVRRFIVDKLES